MIFRSDKLRNELMADDDQLVCGASSGPYYAASINAVFAVVLEITFPGSIFASSTSDCLLST